MMPQTAMLRYTNLVRTKNQCSKSGVGKLFTRRATFEKTLKPRVALIERAKKQGPHVLRCPVFL